MDNIIMFHGEHSDEAITKELFRSLMNAQWTAENGKKWTWTMRPTETVGNVTKIEQVLIPVEP